MSRHRVECKLLWLLINTSVCSMAIFMYPSKQAKMPTTQTQFTASDATPAWLQQRTLTSVVNSRIQLHDNRLSFYRFEEVCWGPSGCSVVIRHSAAARLRSACAAKTPRKVFTAVIERFRDLLEASWSGVQDARALIATGKTWECTLAGITGLRNIARDGSVGPALLQACR